MPGLGWVFSLLEKLLPVFFRKKEPVELVVDGFSDLTDGQQNFIKSLEARVTDLEKSNLELQKAMKVRRRRAKKLTGVIGACKKEIEECNKDRESLKERVLALELISKDEKDYAHDAAHLFEGYMKALEIDLESHGIKPDARESILKLQREREAARAKEQLDKWRAAIDQSTR
jgi:hypothetical protein